MKGKTQAWPEVVRQVEVEEQVEEEDKGAEGQVELENGQQQEPDDDVVPTLWQWLRRTDILTVQSFALLADVERVAYQKIPRYSLICHSLFLLEDVAGVPLLLDLLQLGKALAPVARCPVTGERSGLRKSVGSVGRVKAVKIFNVVIVTGARESVFCM